MESSVVVCITLLTEAWGFPRSVRTQATRQLFLQ